VRVINKFKHSTSIREFCEELNINWISNKIISRAIEEIVNKIIPFINSLPSDTFLTLKDFKESKNYSFRLINLMRSVHFLGFIFHIQDLEEIKAIKLLNNDCFISAMGSFLKIMKNMKEKESISDVFVDNKSEIKSDDKKLENKNNSDKSSDNFSEY
jgi:hypothetical protein